ncbi:hypothetical protein GCM10011335_15430 [Aureimonas glaciei]|uniref:Uncharacterized protein n=2 Tax=Aureimonas glaciei TaxID=1776957 RepID=A0A917D9G8_9HYPH|nr:hypothetical protein GCM10011335_15430 [Aureimonas glaciei]
MSVAVVSWIGAALFVIWTVSALAIYAAIAWTDERAVSGFWLAGSALIALTTMLLRRFVVRVG